MEGQGLFKYSNGDEFSGIMSGDMKSEGTIRFSNGNKYTGSFEDDLFNGYGEFAEKSGQVYRGFFKVR